MIEERKTKTTAFTHTNKQSYGGYITYFKLYCQLWQTLLSNKIDIGLPHKIMSPYQLTISKIGLGIAFILKAPWWLIIKPLGAMFHKVTISEGKVTVEDGKVVCFDGEKHITMHFLGVPIWYKTSKKFTDEEINDKAGLNE